MGTIYSFQKRSSDQTNINKHKQILEKVGDRSPDLSHDQFPNPVSQIVTPELGIASTFISFSHTSRALNQSNIYALSMEFSMQLAKLHVLPWGSLKMMESGTCVSQKHAKSMLVPQSVTYLQSYWHSMHQ